MLSKSLLQELIQKKRGKKFFPGILSFLSYFSFCRFLKLDPVISRGIERTQAMES